MTKTPTLADMLRSLVREDGRSLHAIAKDLGLSQPTLYRFVVPDKDGHLADMGIEKAQKLIDLYKIKITAPKRA